MKITADTNVLLRLVMGDDEAQSAAAIQAVENASLIALSVHSLCEFAWVLGGRYGMPRPHIAAAIRALIGSENVVVNRPTVNAGLAVLEAGGDFADGVIAIEGRWLGGETFVSFRPEGREAGQTTGCSACASDLTACSERLSSDCTPWAGRAVRTLRSPLPAAGQNPAPPSPGPAR